ncbi:DeoR/GlpR family DNA-binding transcription regulator [uncultured Microbacterium sp.]|uniref:DeoR/GlpR family DNA-binding transcription regulator n=1 Tax=uncultured Microbacterium sp. TaxID=191216 RepID=UPI0035CC6D97
MIAAQRRNLILDYVRSEGAVSINDLAERLHTSSVTIRRDLSHLDEAGLLTRTHGGAIADPATSERSYSEKTGQAMAEKRAIGRYAADLVHDGDVIVIGPGTTTEAFARNLVDRIGLTIITNSLPVAETFVSTPQNQLIMTGGTLRGSIRALVGEATNRTLRGIHADKTFLSGNGLVADFGLSTPSMLVADADSAMAAAAHETIVLADYTKFGLRSAIQTLATEAIGQIVTDSLASADEISSLRRAGVSVAVA